MKRIPDDSKVPALVLGSGVTALGVIRALGRKGLPLYAASGGPGLERHSRWYRRAPGQLEWGKLERYLGETPLERAVVIPCSDGLAEAVASLPDEMRSRFPASVPEPDLLRTLVDKAGLSGVLDEHHVPHPQTLVLERPDDLSAWRGPLDDAFVKPRSSQKFFARYGVKALRPDAVDDIETLIRQVLADGLELVVQEYVPGPATNHYFIDGFMDRDGAVGGIFARRRLRMYPPWFGNSSALRSVPREETAAAEEDLVRMLRAVGYRGMFSAEFKRDARDGTFRLLEINARAWWYVEFAARCGVDVVSMAYEDALGNPLTVTREYQVGRTLVYPYYDFFACREARRRGEGGALGGLTSWIGADHTIFARDDPAPFFAELGQAGRRYVGRRLPRRRGRESRTRGSGS